MKNSIVLTLITLLSLLLFTSCASSPKSQSQQVIPKNVETNTRIRTTSSTNNSDVVCHNCRAKFKLSMRIQKLVHDGNAEVKCPVCHKNYLTGEPVKN
jgi:type IV pilus biogenesis protein CpaD/CtpE